MAENAQIEKLSFKLRLKAWWEGYDAEEYLLHLNGNPQDKKELPPPKKNTPPVENLPPLEWTEKRIELAQLIWGEGYCGPGGSEYVKSLSKMLCLTDKMSVAVIGAKLGGPTRVLADEFSSWVSGFEISNELVKRGNELSLEADLKDKAVLVKYDPVSDEPFERKFDRCFAKETIYSIEDKPVFLKKIFDNLKNDGLLLITDYCLLNEESMINSDVQKWQMQETTAPFFITEKEMKKNLEDAGFNVRVNEDISEDYIKIISKNWAGAEKILASLSPQDEMDSLQIIMKDAESWNLLSKLLSDKHIQVRKYLAHKK